MEQKKYEMEYRYLGNTGLKVSVLSFGNMVNDDKSNSEHVDIIKTCWDHGINFFDTAEMYTDGKAEECLAVSLKKFDIPRDEVVISTKLFGGFGNRLRTENRRGTLSNKHLQEGIDASLKRLELDYVDVIFAHRFDKDTPIEEICRGYN
jgi:aryl-alcohol dehydrogenase-like predicted oxidoreductase